MENVPQKNTMIYEDAREKARADSENWLAAQIWTPEDHIVRTADLQIHKNKEGAVHAELRALGTYTLENLTALGEKFDLMADFDLENESLKVYCQRNGIEISQD